MNTITQSQTHAVPTKEVPVSELIPQSVIDQAEAERVRRAKKLTDTIVAFSKDPDIVEAVKKIEARGETTQYHYGDYLGFLSPYSGDKLAFTVISRALVLAGANPDGVEWACRLIKGGGQ